MEVAVSSSNGATSPGPPNTLIPPFNTALLIDYLSEVLAITLGASKQDLEAPGSLFSDLRFTETTQRLSRYATEPLVALYATKETAEGDVTVDPTGSSPLLDRTRASLIIIAPPSYIYSLSSELASIPTTIASVAIIKRPTPLDSTIPLHAQLQIINLPGTLALGGTQGSVSPFEILHSMVHSALAPYFDAYTKGQEAQKSARGGRFADAEAKTGRH